MDDDITVTKSIVDESAVTTTRSRLVKAGYVPVPCHGKAPVRKEWQQLYKDGGVNNEQIELWAKVWPNAVNTGILTRDVPTLDVDILNEEAVDAIEELVNNQFEADAGRLLTRIGRPPKRAFLFRTDEPFDKITINLTASDGATGQKLEFLCDGQQVVVDGVHPDTGRPYTWFGGEPGNIKRKDLPVITEFQARELSEHIANVLINRFGYTRSASRPSRGKKSKGETGGGSADWEYLANQILSGSDLHDATRDLAAKMVTAGTEPGAIINQIRGFLNLSTAPKDNRWQERFDDIPNLVDSAIRKFNNPEPEPSTPSANLPPKKTLTEVREVFAKWLGKDFDLDVVDATAAAAAAEKLQGDPLWVLIVGGSGGGKTETSQSLAGAGAHVTSTISSEGALLSATPVKQRSKKATGGLLRKIGDRGILVIKDFTSILSAGKEIRGTVLAALREIYDGKWERNVGSEGGLTLTWNGRIVIVACVTTAWDAAHSVVSSMGDRFVLLRPRSTAEGRQAAGKKSISNTGSENAMRKEMAEVMGGLIAHVDTTPHQLSEDEITKIVNAADLVTTARSAVEKDYQGNVVFAHDPEMPTRFTKQLVQLLRGGVAIGMTPEDAMQLVIRSACDSIPPIRRDILLELSKNPKQRAAAVRKAISQPYTTAKRELDALHMLKALKCDEEDKAGHDGKSFTVFKYSLADKYDRDTLAAVADRKPTVEEAGVAPDDVEEDDIPF
jgi:hypothetical protein